MVPHFNFGEPPRPILTGSAIADGQDAQPGVAAGDRTQGGQIADLVGIGEGVPVGVQVQGIGDGKRDAQVALSGFTRA